MVNTKLLDLITQKGVTREIVQEILNISSSDTQQKLQNALNHVYPQIGLGTTIDLLFEQQIQSGFIGDTLDGVEVATMFDPVYDITFSAMFNPKREERAKGFGLKKPPEDSGYNFMNDGCFLCLENIVWQQKGKQKGFYWNPWQSINEYNILTNPFPIFNRHVTIASASHVIQRINSDHLRDMLQFLDEAEDYLIFFNGQDAGASIPWHLHMQACRQDLPIEQARDKIVIVNDALKISLLHYPAPVIKITGSNRYLLDLAGSMIVKRWMEADPNYHNTINYIGTKRNGEFQIYLVLRDILKNKTPWMKGMPASVEMGGVIIWSHPDDRAKFDNFEKGFDLNMNGSPERYNGLDIIKGIMFDIQPSETTIKNFINNLCWAQKDNCYK